jgi:hypothetical protein
LAELDTGLAVTPEWVNPGRYDGNFVHAFLAVSILAFLLFWSALAQAYDHATWDTLLKRHVQPIRAGVATEVDYAGMVRERAALKGYLDGLAAVRRDEFNRWPHPERLAFLINAYNAWTLELILTAWPEVKSIKELGSLFRSPWKKSFIPLLGETRSLDDIEHGMIRAPGAFDDPRIHFAVNCASLSCPALASEAFVGERLEIQLQRATQRFLADRTRNRYDPERGELQVSRLFDWYGSDFAQGHLGIPSLQAFFTQHAAQLSQDPQHQARIQAGDYRLSFLPYDWSLNDRSGR